MTAAAQLAPAPLPRGIFVATFRPAAHWSRDIQRHAGLRCSWRRAWRVTAGPFRGQWACLPMNGAGRLAGRPALAWAPERELVDVEAVR